MRPARGHGHHSDLIGRRQRQAKDLVPERVEICERARRCDSQQGTLKQCVGFGRQLSPKPMQSPDECELALVGQALKMIRNALRESCGRARIRRHAIQSGANARTRPEFRRARAGLQGSRAELRATPRRCGGQPSKRADGQLIVQVAVNPRLNPIRRLEDPNTEFRIIPRRSVPGFRQSVDNKSIPPHTPRLAYEPVDSIDSPCLFARGATLRAVDVGLLPMHAQSRSEE